MSLRLAVLVGALAGCCLFSACDQGPAVGTVTGEVTFDGQPIKQGRIEFKPLDGKGGTGGAEIVDGKFTAVGVPTGKMRVELHGNKPTGKKIKAYDTPDSPVADEIVELLPHKYHVTSEITLDVKRGPQNERYDLKSK